MKFCCVQMQIKEADGEINRQTANHIINDHAGADFYLLPELWSSGYCHSEWLNMAKEDTPKAILFMQNQAKDKQAWIGGSLIYLDENYLLRNRFLVINPEGELVGHYDKTHLFALMDEHLYLTAGNKNQIFEINGFNIAPTICYDLRFPEMYRRLALKGIDVFLVSAEWPAAREQIMTTLSQARAIESQAFLILSNRIGLNDRNELFAGQSMIIGPTGILASAFNETDTAVTFTISKSDQVNARKMLPTFEQRLAGVDYD
ncbi:nitrilase-related carbon-nitrogen hydrolase [Legionella pneumophila]|uniref:nitrilase-related carbon-nitrogen hydrolase n=2 Tax=Legionella pneumophila TaxID=446 RepID=UPI00067F599C|nr:nitrilase-related carbon-nitrogen hydrolase [Legionella pneumophila]BCL64490.1 hydrolase [Legionella pneumophila serogroup 11]VEB29530.1 hydrolase [Legionella pneumophila]HAT1942838.1 hypothetical protein [Legionella pneumophila]HAT8690504.1 hypothetical protein [Legionella pneumophila]HAT8727921.1 hypothetical protein [Legionella pneumophila]